MTSYLRPDTKVTDNRRSKFRFGHSHRAVRTIDFAPADCLEPMVTGSNILRDPGFESGGDDPSLPGRMPMENDGFWTGWPDIHYDIDPGTPSVDKQGWTPTLGWAADFDWLDRYHRYVTTDPRTGTYHIQSQTSVESFTFDTIWVVDGRTCPFDDTTKFVGYYAARVEPGTVVDFSIYAKYAFDVSATNWVTDIHLFWYKADGSFLSGGFAQVTTTLTTSYTQAGINVAAPALAYYLSVGISADHDGFADDAALLRYDDAVLGIT